MKRTILKACVFISIISLSIGVVYALSRGILSWIFKDPKDKDPPGSIGEKPQSMFKENADEKLEESHSSEDTEEGSLDFVGKKKHAKPSIILRFAKACVSPLYPPMRWLGYNIKWVYIEYIFPYIYYICAYIFAIIAKVSYLKNCLKKYLIRWNKKNRGEVVERRAKDEEEVDQEDSLIFSSTSMESSIEEDEMNTTFYTALKEFLSFYSSKIILSLYFTILYIGRELEKKERNRLYIIILICILFIIMVFLIILYNFWFLLHSYCLVNFFISLIEKQDSISNHNSRYFRVRYT